MNLFDTARERLNQTSTARNDGYAHGFATGRDTGRTETLNNVRDAVDSASLSTRVSKKRLMEHIERNA